MTGRTGHRLIIPKQPPFRPGVPRPSPEAHASRGRRSGAKSPAVVARPVEAREDRQRSRSQSRERRDGVDRENLKSGRSGGALLNSAERCHDGCAREHGRGPRLRRRSRGRRRGWRLRCAGWSRSVSCCSSSPVYHPRLKSTFAGRDNCRSAVHRAESGFGRSEGNRLKTAGPGNEGLTLLTR